jgi:hypothetical protein
MISTLGYTLRVTRARRREGYGGEWSDQHLLAALNAESKNIPEDCEEARHLLKALEDRLSFHRHRLLKAKTRHGRFSFAFALIIPVGSAFVTWVMQPPESLKYLADYSSIFGGILTILTIINSVLRPTEKVLTAAHLLVQLHDWETDLAAGLSKKLLPEPKSVENGIMDFLLLKDRELSKIGTESADRLLPQTPHGGQEVSGSGPSRPHRDQEDVPSSASVMQKGD